MCVGPAETLTKLLCVFSKVCMIYENIYANIKKPPLAWTLSSYCMTFKMAHYLLTVHTVYYQNDV